MPLESTFHNMTAYLFQTIPTMLYLCLLLRLPALYFSRVARVFENADLSQRDIDRMAVARVSQWGRHPEAAPPGIWQYEPQPDEKVSVTLLQFKSSWEHFVENLLKEWKTLNVVSALLTSYVPAPSLARVRGSLISLPLARFLPSSKSMPPPRTPSCARRRCSRWCAR